MLDAPTGRARGVLQIAATISNALIGALLLVAGALSLVLIGVVAIDIANETWITLGERITAELGSDIAALFAMGLGGSLPTVLTGLTCDSSSLAGVL